MFHWSKNLVILVTSFCFATWAAASTTGRPDTVGSFKREQLQDLVTWDEHSLFVRGERVMVYSGEFHPFRLPVPDLWRDVFQKVKALGFNAVSFYVDWALLEGKPGQFTADGVFAFDELFEAAASSGIYLIARPGPYVNAELSGGGFPGWLQRNPGILRTNESAYVDATQNYVSHIGAIIAKAQITNGGPVILFQVENEYTFGADWITFPDALYFGKVEEQFRNAGIVVPLINNDAWYGAGRFVPGTPSAVDIYGVDSYPAGFDCAHPDNWAVGSVPTDYRAYHEQLSPTTPFMIVEFQGGAVDLWGGPGYDQCAALTGSEFERVYNKNDLAAGVSILNFYMIYGGTNWGNLGQPGGYTSYDYGAAIKEDRSIVREKYSEAKLQANFLAVSPAYLTSRPGNLTNGTYVSNDGVAVTPLWGNKTNFYVVRPADYVGAVGNSLSYELTVNTSIGIVSVPRLGGSLSLHGRDSKIHVTDYDLGDINLIYSSAEVFTWRKLGNKTVLLLYGGADETHEFAVRASAGSLTTEGDGIEHQVNGSIAIVNWQVAPTRRVVHFGDTLDVYLLWRNDAYDYWVLELPAAEPIGNYSSRSKDAVIARSGYLLRTASMTGSSLSLTGDTNATTDLEIIAGHPTGSSSLIYNGQTLENVHSAYGRLSATVPFSKPTIELPDLSKVSWNYIDSLPEIQNSYDDSLWTSANLTKTPNTSRNLTTPTSLYAGDYGYHAGLLIYRGRFVASSNASLVSRANSSTTFYVSTQGGGGFAHSVWLNSTFLGSWPGSNANSAYNQTLQLPNLEAGNVYFLTVLIDHMGTESNWGPGYDQLKTPRGILDYSLSGHAQSAITWKLTGNLGGEQYRDQTRGPLNEGGTFAERQGYHQPSPPSHDWQSSSPLQGLSKAGIGFYTTTFTLDVPSSHDVPMSFSFTNATSLNGRSSSDCAATDYRMLLFVNGYQFGRYINNIGPQTSFPVPPGILNPQGQNTVALTLWALSDCGAKLDGISLQPTAIIQSALGQIQPAPQPKWQERPGAY